MPIYAYKCSACGYAQDVLQKISDPPLSQCPQCQAATFTKQVTAAGFQLKGSGWYVTDFRGSSTAAAPAATPAASEGAVAAAPAPTAAPAPSPAAAPAPAPAGGSAGTK